MEQVAALRELDADIMESMVSAGFANIVTVTVPGGDPMPGLDAYIDRTRQESGDQAQVAQAYVQITLLRSQIDDVPIGSEIDVLETGEIFAVDSVLPGDESSIVCIVMGG